MASAVGVHGFGGRGPRLRRSGSTASAVGVHGSGGEAALPPVAAVRVEVGIAQGTGVRTDAPSGSTASPPAPGAPSDRLIVLSSYRRPSDRLIVLSSHRPTVRPSDRPIA